MALAAYNFAIQDSAGNIVTDVDVEVRQDTVGQPLVQLFSDRDGLSALGNPFTSATGTGRFHVAGGAYQIRAFKDGFEIIHRYVGIGTASELDTEDLLGQILPIDLSDDASVVNELPAAKGGNALHPNTRAIIAQYTAEPSDAFLVALDRAVRRLYEGGWDEILDALYIGFGEAKQQSLIDILNPAGTALSEQGAVDHVKWRGWDLPGTSGNYFDTGRAANAQTHFAQDDAFIMAWPTEDVANDGYYELGTSSGTELTLRARHTDDEIRVALNSATGAIVDNLDSRGMVWAYRNPSDVGNVGVGKNDRLLGTDAAASATVTSGNFLIGRQSANYSGRALGAVAWGKCPLSAASPPDPVAKIAELYDILQELWTAIIEGYQEEVTAPLPLRVMHLDDVDLYKHFGVRANGQNMSSRVQDALEHLAARAADEGNPRQIEGVLRLGTGKIYCADRITVEIGRLDLSIVGNGRMVSGFYTDNGTGILQIQDSAVTAADVGSTLSLRDLGFFAAVDGAGAPLNYEVARSGPRNKWQAKLDDVYFGIYDLDGLNSSAQAFDSGPLFVQLASGGADVSPRRVHLNRVQVESGNNTTTEMSANVAFGQAYGPLMTECIFRASGLIGVSRICSETGPEHAIRLVRTYVVGHDVGVYVKSSAEDDFIVTTEINDCHINSKKFANIVIDGAISGFIKNNLLYPADPGTPTYGNVFHNILVLNAVELDILDNIFRGPNATKNYCITLDPDIVGLAELAAGISGGSATAGERKVNDCTIRLGMFAPRNADDRAVTINNKRCTRIDIELPRRGKFVNDVAVTNDVVVGGHSAASVTISNASPAVVTLTGHGIGPDIPFRFNTSGALPNSLVENQIYYRKDSLTANTFTFSATPGGAAVNTSSAGSGSHTLTTLGFTNVQVLGAFGVANGASYSNAQIVSQLRQPNVFDKYAGKLIWDTTNNRLMRARGSGATDVWDVVDGSASVTPS